MPDDSNVEILPLMSSHDRKKFDCGNGWLNAYIRQHAIKNQELGYGRSYIACNRGSSHVKGFYTLSMGAIEFATLSDDLAQRVPKYPMPTVHMGCLAVDQKSQGQKLGSLLLIDAMSKVSQTADIIAARVLEVRAIDEKAKAFYRHFGFVEFKDSPLHLYLPTQTIRTLLGQ